MKPDADIPPAPLASEFGRGPVKCILISKKISGGARTKGREITGITRDNC